MIYFDRIEVVNFLVPHAGTCLQCTSPTPLHPLPAAHSPGIIPESPPTQPPCLSQHLGKGRPVCLRAWRVRPPHSERLLPLSV